MATNFEPKLAITQLVWEISPRSLHQTGGFVKFSRPNLMVPLSFWYILVSWSWLKLFAVL